MARPESASLARSAEHPKFGTLRVAPYGRDHVLIDVRGPTVVTSLRAALLHQQPTLRPRPGWSSVLVRASDSATVLELVMSLDDGSDLQSEAQDAAHHHLIDTSYDGDDLETVARLTDLTVDAVINAHSSATYYVVFLGFTRAFAYLDGLDPRLGAVPRLATPRVRVPAGSIGIAAGQTGIYPMASPGGWHLLGHTDAVLFDTSRTPPSLLAPGDTVQFRAV